MSTVPDCRQAGAFEADPQDAFGEYGRFFPYTFSAGPFPLPGYDIPVPDSSYQGRLFTRGKKRYELKNHLGNVLVTLSDRKLQVDNGSGGISHYLADVWSGEDYYPFGMGMPGRGLQLGGYRFGFQGQETDGEVYGEGNSYGIGARNFDPRTGRWFSKDPKESEFPSHSPYSGNGNNPVLFTDPNGEQIYLPENSQYSEQAIIHLSLITGYRLEMSEKAVEFEHPALGKVRGYEIIVTKEELGDQSRVVPGYGEELRKLFNIRDVKVLADLRPLKDGNRVNSYTMRKSEGLVFDSDLFNDSRSLFIAHLWVHELTETISLARNRWKIDRGSYKVRDHFKAWKADIQAIMGGMNLQYFDEGNAWEDTEREDEIIYQDPGNSMGSRTIQFIYTENEEGKYIEVDINYYGPGGFDPYADETRGEKREKVKPEKFPKNDK